MTLGRIIERIQREFPDVKGAEIVEDINDIQKDYCIETEILKTSGNITIVANTVTYNLLTEFPTLDKVLRVDFLDSSGEPVGETDELKMDIKPDGNVTFYDFYGDVISSIGDTVATIKFYYSYTPATLVIGTLTASPDTPSQLHDGLVYGELARLYARIPTTIKTYPDGSTAKAKDFNSVQFNEAKYREYVIKGKKLANQEKSSLSVYSQADQF